MKALADMLLLLVIGLVVVAVAGDALTRFVHAVTVPVLGLLLAAAIARLVWFYTSRW